jgi:hypothetical protein
MVIIKSETFDEDKSFVFQSVVFYSESKNLIIEKRDVKNKKGKSCLEINLWKMWPSQIYQIHRAIGDALDISIGGLEVENVKLKLQIKELEETLMHLPVIASPLAMINTTSNIFFFLDEVLFITSPLGSFIYFYFFTPMELYFGWNNIVVTKFPND